MTDTVFDTLAATRNLEAAGVIRAHAEAIADTVRQAAVADRDALATKADITHLEDKLETKADLYRALGYRPEPSSGPSSSLSSRS